MGVNELIKIGSRIKQVRNQLGLTQQMVADSVGVKLSTYSNYENDNREPPAEVIEKIASCFGISPFQLIGATYFDKKYPKIAKEVKEFESFLDFLDSLDYKIQEIEESSVIPSELLPEEVKDKVPFEGTSYSITISKGKNTNVTLTESEFQQFQEAIKKAVEFELYQRKK